MAIVNWGILSTAEIANKVVKAMHSAKNAKPLAVASRSHERAEKWAKEHGVEKSFGDYDDLIQCEDIQAIYIPLPTALKTQWAEKAALMGKHVLIEKPMPGTDMRDVERMLETCASRGVQFMDGTMWLHSIRTQKIQEVISSGKIGKIKRVLASFTFPAPDDEWLNGGNGRTDKTREPMGCFGDQGWYPIGAILFAMNYDTPLKVRMDSWELNKVDTVIYCSGTLWFSGGRTAVFDCGVTCCHRSQFEIVGTEGAVRVEDHVGGQGRSGNFKAYEDEFTGSSYFKMDDMMGKETIVNVAPCDHTKLMIETFSDCTRMPNVEGGWPQKTLLEHRVLVALFQSLSEGGELCELQM